MLPGQLSGDPRSPSFQLNLIYLGGYVQYLGSSLILGRGRANVLKGGRRICRSSAIWKAPS
jgi:hypothetical protein